MHRTSRLLFLLLPWPLLATVALGQVAPANPEPPLYMLEIHTLKPGQDTEYENSVRELLGGLRAADVRFPSWHFAVMRASPTLYMTIDPMANWAMLDTFDSETEEVMKLLGATMRDFMKRSHATNARESEFFIQSEQDNDVAGPLGENGLNFTRFDFYYASSMHSVMGALSSVKRLYVSSRAKISCGLYRAVTGDDLPLVIVAVSATDQAEFDSEQGRVDAASGPELKHLLALARGASRRVETFNFVARPDLSYRVEPKTGQFSR
jgi:hypothetical protein